MLLILLLINLITCFDLNIDRFEQFDNNDIDLLRYVNEFIDVKELPPIKSIPLKDSDRTLGPGEIPDFVFEFNPIVYLYTEELYLPYDIEDYVKHFKLQTKEKQVVLEDVTLQGLSNCSKHFNTSDLFLTSKFEFDNDPLWLTGKYNKPNLNNGEIKNASSILIVVEKGNDWIDAYWFYFYSFNQGPFVMGKGPYGNHLGDWEHSLTRFYKGIPIYVWMSAHGGGGSYHYKALEKSDIDFKKPIIFSAKGTHANYPSTGQHQHDLPFGILSDFTDRGSLWDPSKNYLGYTWDGINLTSNNERDLEDWLLYQGHWGDDKLAPSDPRQVWSPWEWKYIEGPTGPLTKNLSRKKLCQTKKWWNFWNGCPAKNYKNLGDGYERENGVMCANFFYWVRPTWLRTIVNYITNNGGLCILMNIFYG